MIATYLRAEARRKRIRVVDPFVVGQTFSGALWFFAFEQVTGAKLRGTDEPPSQHEFVRRAPRHALDGPPPMINPHTIGRERHGQLLIDRIVIASRRQTTVARVGRRAPVGPRDSHHRGAAQQPSITSGGEGRAVRGAMRGRFDSATTFETGTAGRPPDRRPSQTGVLQGIEFARFL